MQKLLKQQGAAPRVMITDKLRSYGAAKRQIMPRVEHRSHKGLNNRAENSHQPTRRRERIMKRFKSVRHLQRFVSIHDPIANLFHLPRHEMTPARTAEQIGEAIRRVRKARSWTQSDISARTNLRVATISSLENGDAGTKLATLLAVMAALGLEFRLVERCASPVLAGSALLTIQIG